ncbi:hypothetical protein NW768_012095 [Fusarium equiseti]|uniref:Uncharacterized protein n=1 Tax=Fusarium equiseti TaxID=61235 RepID=A0ABQ8QVQ2_FUSEQ|nr:hypothetical protein NW768_012095 [Fusarium equiseti]
MPAVVYHRPSKHLYNQHASLVVTGCKNQPSAFAQQKGLKQIAYSDTGSAIVDGARDILKGEVPAANNIATALSSKSAVKNSNYIQAEIDAIVEKAQIVGKIEIEESAVIVGVWNITPVALVATPDSRVRSADFLSFGDFERIDLGLSPAFEIQGSRGRGEDDGSSHEMHFKGN